MAWQSIVCDTMTGCSGHCHVESASERNPIIVTASCYLILMPCVSAVISKPSGSGWVPALVGSTLDLTFDPSPELFILPGNALFLAL